MLSFTVVLIFALCAALTARAEGEDAPGPHGGYVQMPANFHTEVIPNKDSSFKIYLLDLDLKSPLVRNSKVVAWVTSNMKRSDYKCKSQIDHFFCQGTKPLNTGTLFIRAIRNGVAAAIDAAYDLPFKRNSK